MTKKLKGNPGRMFFFQNTRRKKANENILVNNNCGI